MKISKINLKSDNKKFVNKAYCNKTKVCALEIIAVN